MGGRKGVSLAATGNGTACSHGVAGAELRRTKTAALLGPAPRRPALRANRRLVSAERRRFTDEVRSGTLKKRVPFSAAPRVTTIALRVSANRTCARFCVTRCVTRLHKNGQTPDNVG